MPRATKPTLCGPQVTWLSGVIIARKIRCTARRRGEVPARAATVARPGWPITARPITPGSTTAGGRRVSAVRIGAAMPSAMNTSLAAWSMRALARRPSATRLPGRA
jgi:hypothetical protein